MMNYISLWLYLLKATIILKVLKILTYHIFHFVFILKFVIIICYMKADDVTGGRIPQWVDGVFYIPFYILFFFIYVSLQENH